jgi:hypothetical protein
MAEMLHPVPTTVRARVPAMGNCRPFCTKLTNTSACFSKREKKGKKEEKWVKNEGKWKVGEAAEMPHPVPTAVRARVPAMGNCRPFCTKLTNTSACFSKREKEIKRKNEWKMRESARSERWLKCLWCVGDGWPSSYMYLWALIKSPKWGGGGGEGRRGMPVVRQRGCQPWATAGHHFQREKRFWGRKKEKRRLKSEKKLGKVGTKGLYGKKEKKSEYTQTCKHMYFFRGLEIGRGDVKRPEKKNFRIK